MWRWIISYMKGTKHVEDINSACWHGRPRMSAFSDPNRLATRNGSMLALSREEPFVFPHDIGRMDDPMGERKIKHILWVLSQNVFVLYSYQAVHQLSWKLISCEKPSYDPSRKGADSLPQEMRDQLRLKARITWYQEMPRMPAVCLINHVKIPTSHDMAQ